MGHAAYMRGSHAISAQFCRDRGCFGCASCSDPTPARTPRPESWGQKSRAQAAAFGSGFVSWCRRSGRDIDAAALAEAIHANVRVGRSTAASVAEAILSD